MRRHDGFMMNHQAACGCSAGTTHHFSCRNDGSIRSIVVATKNPTFTAQGFWGRSLIKAGFHMKCRYHWQRELDRQCCTITKSLAHAPVSTCNRHEHPSGLPLHSHTVLKRSHQTLCQHNMKCSLSYSHIEW